MRSLQTSMMYVPTTVIGTVSILLTYMQPSENILEGGEWKSCQKILTGIIKEKEIYVG